jgi:thiol:disulfide interchange protein DsbD
MAAATLVEAQLIPPGSPAQRRSRDFPATVSAQVTPEKAKPGDRVTLEVTVEFQPGYHTYAIEQPDLKAVATKITLDSDAPLQLSGTWTESPPHGKFDDVLKALINTHEGKATFSHELVVPGDAAVGEHMVSGSIKLTVCDATGCLPPKDEPFEATVVVEASSGPAPRVPAPPPAPTDASVGPTHLSDPSAMSGQSPGADAPPAARSSVVLGPPQGFKVQSDSRITDLAGALAFGFLAGLILNVMPCVLPVISLKIYGFVKQAGESPARVRLLGLTFGAGILFVFLILAALAAFAGLKWGQQFQNDVFQVSMIALMVAFALGMFDIYVIQLPGVVSDADAATAHSEGLVGSFAKGMLATILATPCSGPFLGATLSYALRLPPAQIFAVFTAIGLGMASPYVMLGFFPGWMRVLPRPGEWMNTFKQFMGFLMLATAVWLLWQRRTNGELVVWTVGFCLFVAVAVWLYGRMSDPLAAAGKRMAAPVVALLLVGLGAHFCFNIMYNPPAARAAVERSFLANRNGGGPHEPGYHWETYDLDKFIALRGQGHTIVVDWTADW